MADLALRAVVLLAAVGGLWLGARTLVDAAVRLARRRGLSDLVIGLTVVAAGTSSPELVVTADAALAGLGDVAVGNVVGSNAFNLAAVLGVASLVRVVPVERALVHRDGVALVVATLLGAAALADLTVSRPEGAALVAALVVYTAVLLRSAGGSGTGEAGRAGTRDGGSGSAAVPPGVVDRLGAAVPGRVRAAVPGRPQLPDWLLVVVGLAVVLVSGHLLVTAASAIARAAGLSEWVIGGTVVAAGTSTPELAVSVVAMGRGSVGVSVGNVVGSNVFNTLGVLGAGALVAPLTVAPAALQGVAWLSVLVVVTVAALWSGRTLSRAEGALLALSEAVRWALGLAGALG